MSYLPMSYTPEAIIRLYDMNPTLTLSGLSRITGWAVSELKTLLIGDKI